MPDDSTTAAAKATDDDDTTSTASAGADDGAGDDGGDDLPDGVKAVLAKERKAARDAQRRAADLEKRVRQFEDAQKSETEKAAERLAETERRAALAERQLLRFEVAAAKGLDSKFADLLTGDSREDMEANADRLLELATVATPKATAADFDGGARADAPNVDMNDFIRSGSRR